MENATSNWTQMTYPFENIKLPYSLAALEPYIDTKTMDAHYSRLLANYLQQLNNILSNRPELQNLNLTELLAFATVNNDLALQHSAGGVYNHFFFFDELRPATGQIIIGITPQATSKITNTFGSWKNMKEQFTAAALSVFGSGYAWLIKNNNGNLEIVTTPNQTVPEGTPILNIDVWEHAYYLKHLNDRKAYLDAFWNVVDWVKFSQKIS